MLSARSPDAVRAEAVDGFWEARAEAGRWPLPKQPAGLPREPWRETLSLQFVSTPSAPFEGLLNLGISRLGAILPYPRRVLMICLTDDFEARSPDELSFLKGERIELVERDDDFGDGWYLGKHVQSGRSGLFPEGIYLLREKI